MRTKVCCVLLLLALHCSAWASRQVQDETGRTVTVPDRVARVVSLAPSLTDTMYALGASDILVGITDYTDYPPDARRQKRSVGAVINPSVETIVTLHPDLVLALPDFNGPETISSLRRLGIPVALFTTGNIENIFRTINIVGRLLNREPAATALIAQLRERLNKIRAQSAGRPKIAVLLVLSLDPFITAGKNAFMTEMIEDAGARSVTDDMKQDWLRLNVEAILERKPDYILLMKNGPVNLQDMQQRAGWRTLAAVEHGHVIMVDDSIQIPAPVGFDGLEDLARQIQAVQAK